MPVPNPAHHSSRPGARLVPWSVRAGLVFLLAWSRPPCARAQMASAPPSASSGQIAPGPDSGVPQTISEQANPGEFQVLNTGQPPRGALDEPFQYGPVIFRPRVSYRYLYTDGLQSSPGTQNKTAVQDLSPGFLVDFGPNWVLDYSPTLRFYSDPNFRNGVDQSVNLHGGVTNDKWNLGLSQSFTESSSPTVQTGTQTDTQSYGTALNAGYQLNRVLTLDMGLNQSLQYASGSSSGTGVQSTMQWSTLEMLNFKFWQQFTFGAGLGGGYVQSDNSPNQTFQNLQGQFGWRITDKTSLQANAGVDDRQFSNNQPNLVKPTYGATLQDQILPNTSISCSLSQAVTPSILQDTVTVGTSYGVGFNQRLLGHLHLGATASYNTDDYVSTQPGTPGRTDHSYSFNTRLSCPFLQRGSLGLTWQYSNNQSTTGGFSYGTTQLGFDVSYSY